ncbi:hypothetical protein SBRY_100126 [Actinacidiphila bryophytorum]|uniref:Uncharacterized protein n=1 Tax=Actinacidiphila bryophytorum TaxID=1436133 RepID=A0A9W4GXT7_9ACTN|nr:hypothetical protein SBRY_100126 [Actinacidiphila bryophytorum]
MSSLSLTAGHGVSEALQLTSQQGVMGIPGMPITLTVE